ncbi:MAG: class B sortase [Oscillospiraceae bacterium]|nr:class B sortase [Oscillospiraceae bacterium]
MSRKLFTDSLSDETVINLTDEMLKQNNINKTKKRFFRLELIKIIPAVAAVALVIGVINILPNLLVYENIGTPGSEAGMTDMTKTDMNMLGTEISDYYGWIIVGGTRITYPVVQTDDNNFYLTHDFNKQESRSGAIFCDYRNSKDILDNRNLVIYGHNMLDGSMFSNLVQYGVNKELFENGMIELYTENTIYYYEIFSANEEDPTYGYTQTYFTGDEEYVDFLNEIKNRSVFQKDVVLDANSKIITLSTCINDFTRDRRFAVRGVLVDSEIIDETYVVEVPSYTLPSEQECYTYDEYLEFFKEYREFYQSQINCVDENWMPISGQPVLTQEMYDEHMAAWDANLEQILKEVQEGKMPKLPSHYFPYATYDTLNPHLDFNCGVDKNGSWVLYNYDGTSDILETFGTKDEMLERSRWWLSRGAMAGEVDMAQANEIYRRLYFADETVDILPDVLQGDEIVNTIPMPPLNSAMIQLAYDRGYRDSTEYTRFIDSTFFQRINNNTLSEDEKKFIYNCICAGDSIPLADDIVGMIYDIGMVTLELENGNMARFELDITNENVTPEEELQTQIDKEMIDIRDEIIMLSKKLWIEDEIYKEYIGGKMLWPLDREFNIISSGFGSRISPVTGQTEFHNGYDIPADYGTDIYAANGGTVLISTYNKIYGNYIVISHGGGITTLYAHASALMKKAGDKVNKGDIIAQVGSTGYSTGNHLYFEYDELGIPQPLAIDDLDYIIAE